MLDFLIPKHKETSRGKIVVYPDFRVSKSKDLMIRGGAFYAVWNHETEMWSTDEYDVQRLVDNELTTYADMLREKVSMPVYVKYMSNFETSSWSNFKLFISKMADSSEQLDNRVVFENTEVKKEDHISKRLGYSIEEGPTPAFDELFGTLYDEDNLRKIMWAIGSIINGDSKRIQKFFVLFGSPGTGKSTVLNVIQEMFPGYFTSFEAQTLTNGASNFTNEAFRDNPLIGINHEGDLSRIRDNSNLNSIVAHDHIVMNVKWQKSYSVRLNTMLFIATNKPVTITDANSGLIRRLVDIRPTGVRVPTDTYHKLVSRLSFESGAIAYSCLKIYESLGRTYYDAYKPIDMMMRTDVFFNFVDEHFYMFVREGAITLNRAWELYKKFCEDANIKYKLPRHAFRDEMRNYWEEFHPYKKLNGEQYRSLFMGFKMDIFSNEGDGVVVDSEEPDDWLALALQESILDQELADRPAQYANEKERPVRAWANVKTTLSEIVTSSLHYVLPPENHIVIDFDLKDGQGDKSLKLNVEAARNFPPTYAEVSKGGSGLHLHYIYTGDVEKLSRIYEPGIEIIAPIGLTSIRRKLSACNIIDVATISTGLPQKGEKVVSADVVKSERNLRRLLLRNMHKEIHPATKPGIDFMYKILNDALDSGLRFDVSDMKPLILDFASNSTNNAGYCIKMALAMPLTSEHEPEVTKEEDYVDDRLVFYDVEVFPNLFLVCWKYAGEERKVQRMFNPEPSEIERLMQYRLVGFNCRRYDNHILWGALLGMNNQDLFRLSSRIVSNDRSAYFREAYGVSYVDVYDYASKKQSLKKWQVELGVFHKELDLPWDEPVDEQDWLLVAEYCDNDVISLEALHNAIIEDFHAREILAELSGRPVNDSTLSHTAAIVFGSDRRPQSQFNYPDLSKEFPGYQYHRGVSTYRGEEVGEGGYVYAEPGIYHDVVYLDIASMHPTTIEVLNLFGPYTQNYVDIKDARMVIKDGELEKAEDMYGGKLKPYLHEEEAPKLGYALKIALNIVYGMTAASFDNPFRDIRNIDNVVAKRGALFMVDLKYALQKRGVKCVHFKTDSVKIANCKPEDIEFVKEFGAKYGYHFGIEDRFEKMALLDNAQLIAKSVDGTWYAVGARMQKPFVFKTLFSKESIEFKDLVESRAVRKGDMYLEIAEGDEEKLVFIGKVGLFCPMKEGAPGAGKLLRIMGDKSYAVAGTKGYLWSSSELAVELQDWIDLSYFRKAVDEAVDKISALGDTTQFLD